MVTTKRRRRKSKGSGRNYVIIGKGGEVIVVSGATGEVTTLDKSRSADVVKLVRQRQALGKELTALLRTKGLVLTDESSVNLEDGD